MPLYVAYFWSDRLWPIFYSPVSLPEMDWKNLALDIFLSHMRHRTYTQDLWSVATYHCCQFHK